MNIQQKEYQKLIDLYTKTLEEKNKRISEYTDNQLVLLDTINDILKASTKSSLYPTIDSIVNKAFAKLKIDTK